MHYRLCLMFGGLGQGGVDGPRVERAAASESVCANEKAWGMAKRYTIK